MTKMIICFKLTLFSNAVTYYYYINLMLMICRTGQPQRQSPDSTYMIPHPPQPVLPQQLPPLQSLDIDFNQQQPGPSGLHLLSPPTHSQGPMYLLSSNSSSSTGGQLVPEPTSGGNVPDMDQSSSRDDQPNSPTIQHIPGFPPQPVFQIPLSQDLLASTQDISTGFSEAGECEPE